MKFEDLLILIGLNYKKMVALGFALIFAPSVSDFMFWGFNGWGKWSVSAKGCIMMWVGGLLIYMAHKVYIRLGGR